MSSRPHIAPSPLKLPLATQVEQSLRRRIEHGDLQPGAKLPSIRGLAEDLSVSRNTVIEAYDRLTAQGLVRSRQGAGYFVEEAVQRTAARGGSSNPKDAKDVAGEIWHLFSESGDTVKLGCGWLPEEWRDAEDTGYAVRQVARMERSALFNYSTPLGSARLRESLRRRLAGLGIAVEPTQILLTTGASHALDLLIRYLLRPGDVVLVESPGYYNLFGLLKLQGIKMVGVPRTEQGPDIEALERLLAEHRPKLFFVNGVLHNPTGTTVSAATSHRLLQLAERHDFLIVEDDIYADFQSEQSVRLAALDQLRRAIYLGSFSKTLSCSLRVGFIATTHPTISALVDIKMFTSIASSRFAEEVAATMMENGSYRKLVERLRRRLDRQLVTTLRLMESAHWQIFARPTEGMFVWARRADVPDSSQLVRVAAKRGVSLSPGAVFTPDLAECPWLRINVSHATDKRATAFLMRPG